MDISCVCPICHSSECVKIYAEANYDNIMLDSYAFASRKKPEYVHHKIARCRKCDLLFCVDTPSQEELQLQYKQADYDSAVEAQYASRTYIKYLKRELKGEGESSKALDIGTGEGSFLKMLLESGWKEVTGIEPSRAPIEFADDTVKSYIINDIFRAADFEENSFDLITIFQTIEHIPDSLKLIKEVKQLLSPNGSLYIVCHNYKSAVNRMLGKKSPIYDIEHLQLFSKHSIHKLLTNAGFSDIKLFKIRNTYPLSYWVKLFPMSDKIKTALLRFFDKLRIGKIGISINVGNIGVIAKI